MNTLEWSQTNFNLMLVTVIQLNELLQNKIANSAEK
jgi:hypothetical protein